MKRLYVLTRFDLDNPVYQAVQGAHAVAQFIYDHPESEWNNEYLVFVDAHDEDHLEYWLWKAEKAGLRFSKFNEPDLNDQLTAVAVETNEETMNLFSKLNLTGHTLAPKEVI